MNGYDPVLADVAAYALDPRYRTSECVNDHDCEACEHAGACDVQDEDKREREADRRYDAMREGA